MNSSLSPYLLKNTVAPFSNVSQQQVNIDASNWPGGFSSNQTSLQYGLPAMRNNVQAAAASALQKGGRRRTLRKKIKNIANKYKMPRRKHRSMKKRVRTLLKQRGGFLLKSRRRSHRSGRGRGSRGMRGGTYHQFGSQIPNTPSYSVAGVPLSSNNLALANPPPISQHSNTASCTDNYDRFTNKGFTFW